jgi:DNA repair protein RecN (Recombination protein N)
MLLGLQIRDLAVIEAVNLELAPGFTVLTGETGAGKSMLVDALALLSGERSDAGAVRPGAARLEVTGTFAIAADSEPARWLADQELVDDDGPNDCSLRRVVGSDGRSKAWINGRPVPIQMLRELGSLLIDICGQQDYQSLRHPTRQRELVDALADHADLLQRLRACHADWRAAHDLLTRLTGDKATREARADTLRFQLRELEALQAKAGECAELEREHLLLQHRQRVAEALERALALAFDDEEHAAQRSLGTAQHALKDAARHGLDVESALKLLGDAEALVSEAERQLRPLLERLESDPEREAATADRLAQLRDAARRHRVTADELPALAERLAAELATLDDSDERRDGLTLTVAEQRAALEQLADEVTAGRRRAATGLATAVTRSMASLGLAGSRFVVDVARTEGEPGPHGRDTVEFRVTTNAGLPPGPLQKVASGGELSRLNLAIQVVARAPRGAATLVFDEVDAGVGGAVAEIVGRELRALSADRQVLCVTHLPQVATLANYQLSVRKVSKSGNTRTTVSLLDDAGRIEETARMLGGVKITAQTRAHAEEMLAQGTHAEASKRRR